MGEVVTEAIKAYVARPAAGAGGASLADLTPEDLGPGTETLSADIDTVAYGA